jgi:hypothetical protein
VVAVAGIVIGASAVASAAEPSLPAQSVAQLLADVQLAAAKSQGPVTATIQETANLGLPALPQVGGISGPSNQVGSVNPLAGTTTISIWYLNQSHVRVAEQAQMAESDLRLDGTQLWLWNSKTQTATHVLLPRAAGSRATASSPSAAVSSATVQEWVSAPAGTTGMRNASPLAAARQVLAALGPSTGVTLGPNVTVAGRSAYQISVAPKTSGSLVSHVLIAIDAARHIPLRVEVFARSSASPAYEVGYTSLTFGPPAMSNFSFTPPAGATVKTVTVPDKVPAGLTPKLGLHGLGGLGLGGLGLGGLGLGALAPDTINGLTPPVLPGGQSQAQAGVSCAGSKPKCPALPKGFRPGTPMLRPALPASILKQIEASFAAHLPKNLSKAQRAAAIKAFEHNLTVGLKNHPDNGGGFFNIRELKMKASATGIIRMAGTPLPAAGTGAPKVLGKDWTSVLATPANPEVAAMVQQVLATSRHGQAQGNGIFFGSSAQAAAGSAGPVPVGPDLAILRALLQASTPVKGNWGSGRLLQSALLTVLVTSKGQVLAGAVTPSVLYADAASLSK